MSTTRRRGQVVSTFLATSWAPTTSRCYPRRISWGWTITSSCLTWCRRVILDPFLEVSGLSLAVSKGFPPVLARISPELPPERAADRCQRRRGRAVATCLRVSREVNGGAQFRRVMAEVEIFLRFSEIAVETKKRDVIQALGSGGAERLRRRVACP